MFDSNPNNSNNNSNKPFLEQGTKEREEAKQIADCINIKICQLYLYKEQPLSAFSQFQSHIQKYKSLEEFIPGNTDSLVMLNQSQAMEQYNIGLG